MPYARYTTFRLQPGNRSRIEQMATEADSQLRGMRGFQSVTYMLDEDAPELGVFTVWETREDAEAVTSLRDRVQQELQAGLEGPPTTHIAQVYEPRM